MMTLPLWSCNGPTSMIASQLLVHHRGIVLCSRSRENAIYYLGTAAVVPASLLMASKTALSVGIEVLAYECAVRYYSDSGLGIMHASLFRAAGSIYYRSLCCLYLETITTVLIVINSQHGARSGPPISVIQ